MNLEDPRQMPKEIRKKTQKTTLGLHHSKSFFFLFTSLFFPLFYLSCFSHPPKIPCTPPCLVSVLVSVPPQGRPTSPARKKQIKRRIPTSCFPPLTSFSLFLFFFLFLLILFFLPWSVYVWPTENNTLSFFFFSLPSEKPTLLPSFHLLFYRVRRELSHMAFILEARVAETSLLWDELEGASSGGTGW